MASNPGNLTMMDAKKIVESKGMDFETFKLNSINELQLDFLNKRGVFKEIEKEHIVAKAFDLLMEDIRSGEPKKVQQNNGQPTEQKQETDHNKQKL